MDKTRIIKLCEKIELCIDNVFNTGCTSDYRVISTCLKNIAEELAKHDKWIPCSEKLPEQDELVLVAVYGSDMIILLDGESVADAFERTRKQGYVTVGFIGSDGWYGADWYPMMIAPTYWMHMPGLPEGFKT